MHTEQIHSQANSLTKEDQEIHELRKLRSIKLKIFQIQSFKKMRSFITNTLPKLCSVNDISIQQMEGSKNKKNYFIPLNSMPECYLCFSKAIPYKKGEKKFLKSIAESIDSNLKKIETWERLQSLKEEWKAAFNAIPQPICLTDQDFNILSTNQAFLQHTEQVKNNIHRKNCFTIFFGSDLSLKEEKSLLKSSILKSHPQKKMIFEIRRQTLKHNRKGFQIIIFTDRTEKIKMEKKISRLEDSAEMGIITSSIAHELNNPLAGIQALLQTTPQKELLFSTRPQKFDIKEKTSEMLSAVQRCQQIVHQLLQHHSNPNLKFLKTKKTKVQKTEKYSKETF